MKEHRDEVFSSRASLDAIFHPAKRDSNGSADVLLVGYEDGTIHLSIYDFFEIGSFNLSDMPQKLDASKAIQHCWHSCFSSHIMLVLSGPTGQAHLYFVPLDLLLIPSTGRYLSLLASKSTQLQNILRYIRQVQSHIYSEFKACQDLPTRFMGNIEEALQEKSHCSWVHAAYHLVVTGHCYPEVKEWLVDELGERVNSDPSIVMRLSLIDIQGHKRWDKAVSTGYENVRRLVHECLLPALERFSVIISRLRGLSRFQESTETLGLSTGELDDAFDTVSCLFLVAHDIQSSCSSELLQFTAFSAWMKLEIEIQATDPSSTSADDTAEKDGMLDHAKVLDYIQGPMHSSRILELLEIYSLSDARPGWNFAAEEKLMYPSFKNARKAHMTGGAPKIRLPGLASIIGRLDAQCQATFGKIAEAQRRKVRIGSSILLADDLPERIASRMVVKVRVPLGLDSRRSVTPRQAMAPFDECQTYIATSQRNHRKFCTSRLKASNDVVCSHNLSRNTWAEERTQLN